MFFEPLESRALLASDFGDAPDTSPGTGAGNYQTLLANDGPRHVIDTTQTSLFLGARVDSEANANPNAKANGDDITTLPDDEDGLVEPAQELALTIGAVPTVRVRARNTTASAATLYGWIDYNRDGVFNNSTERASLTVPAATTGGTFTLTFPTIPTGNSPGKTFARFRLSSDAAAANSTGAATGGEVEDYAVTIARRSTGTADSAKGIEIGNSVNGGPPLMDFAAFGGSLAALGDLDGDGVADLVAGSPNDSEAGPQRGAAHVLFMNPNGTVKGSVKLASGVSGVPALQDDDYFGSAVASLGDLDGDGVTDLAVGAYGDSSQGTKRELCTFCS